MTRKEHLKFGAEIGNADGKRGIGYGSSRESALRVAKEALRLGELGLSIGFSHICRYRLVCPVWEERSLYWDNNHEVASDCVERCYLFTKHLQGSS